MDLGDCNEERERDSTLARLVLSRLGTFFTHVLPMILGLRVEGAGLWEGGEAFGVIVYAL